MPRFFYTRGSRDLMLRSSCQPRHIRSICLGFKLTEAVLHCRVNKNPKSFNCSSNIHNFLLLRATRTQLPLFHYTSAVRFGFTTVAPPLHHRYTAAAPPLHRRGGCFGAAAASSSSLSNHHHSSSAPFVLPAPSLHYHFTVDEIVPAPLHLRLLRAWSSSSSDLVFYGMLYKDQLLVGSFNCFYLLMEVNEIAIAIVCDIDWCW